MERETLEYDVLIVGAGPAGLAAAVRLGQMAQAAGSSLRICVLEKGAAVGSHALSGALIDPVGLDRLIPDWREQHGFAWSQVTSERHLVLDEESATLIPTFLMPPQLRLTGGIAASLGDVCHWLGQQAEALGVDVCAGFAAVEPIIEAGALAGVLTGDMGRSRNGAPKSDFAPGVAIRARYTLVAEGARGSLARQLEAIFDLPDQPQQYALGIKELWRIDPARYRHGLAIHAAGWPLGKNAHGGAFLYHLPGGLAAVGLVTHLDYRNPWLDPFEEFQRAKMHPVLIGALRGGERIGFGARALACGGLQSVPELVFPGGALLGCSAGLLDPSRGKGIHGAMLSGIAAAEAAFNACTAGRGGDKLFTYPQMLKQMPIWRDLVDARNFKPWIARLGTGLGGFLAGGELWLARMRVEFSWTLAHRGADHQTLLPANACAPIEYPRIDGRIGFDRAASLRLAGVMHAEDQPCHLSLKDPALPIADLPRHAAPETRYCPAGVYEIAETGGQKRLLIHAADCLHCKTCDIKDARQNIVWMPPEGGGGPNYRGM